jgi:hypothetical protein
MTRLRVLAGVAAWLVVVAGVSTVVWLVISSAGAQLIASQQPLVARTTDSGPGPSSTTPAAPSPGVERRTWEGASGSIIATCDGSTIRLVSTQPADGFHAEVKDDGPDELEVEFEAREDRSAGDVTVIAHCVSGFPDFAAETSRD